VSRLIDYMAAALVFAFTGAMAFNAIDIQTHVALGGAGDYPGVVGGNMPRLCLIAYCLARGTTALPFLIVCFPVLVLFAILAMVSSLWSVEPERTVAATIDLMITIAVVHTLVHRLGGLHAIQVFLLLGLVVTLVSAAIATMGHPYALMSGEHAGRWRGMFTHKNSFAMIAAVTLLFAVTLPGGPKRRFLRLGAVAVCGVALAKAGSVSSIAAVAGALAITTVHFVTVRAFQHSLASRVIALCVLIVAVGIVHLNMSSILQALGRDSELSGRIELWQSALPFVQTHVFGHGYGTGGGEAVVNAMRAANGWEGARQVHNGYLALALDLGWGAMLAYALWLTRLIMLTKRLSQSSLGLATSAIASFAAINAFAESASGPYAAYPFLALLLVWFAARAETTPAAKRSTMASTVKSRAEASAPARNREASA
jgi:exopolysaccharide production protein ExoQ